MTKWREAVLLMMATGFAWYLFLAPQHGPGSVDNRARDGLETSRQALMTAGDAAGRAAKNLISQ